VVHIGDANKMFVYSKELIKNVETDSRLGALIEVGRTLQASYAETSQQPGRDEAARQYR
jgi:hypothetical protein